MAAGGGEQDRGRRKRNGGKQERSLEKKRKEGGDSFFIKDSMLLISWIVLGALQYLTLTRPDIQFAVQPVCLHMHSPCDVHWSLDKCMLRYIRGTLTFGLRLCASASTELFAYTDADWAGCPDTRRSTSGYCVFFDDSLISWSSKRQPTVSRSSAEAEYRAVANVVAEICGLRQLLGELRVPIPKATVVFCDNVSATYLAANPVQHKRTKHMELDVHFVREKVQLG
ncbi:secreted RxLR effector protein 161-like [Aegilops tauschii subsp. strangulata]|uniref:secreted RxLR effector protein 161-like n=1 Tax=Aegilops tauschii subsp. strangulata TaxID=200361 RepID=UPI00098A8B9D